MMSFSMLAALTTRPQSNAMHAKRSALASIQVYRHDVHDARGDEDEKQRGVQGVPHAEEFLEGAKLRHFPGCAQSPRDIVKGDALESLLLRGDRFVSRSHCLDRGASALAQVAFAGSVARIDHKGSGEQGGATPIPYTRETALPGIETLEEPGERQSPFAPLPDLVSVALQLGQDGAAAIRSVMDPA